MRVRPQLLVTVLGGLVAACQTTTTSLPPSATVVNTDVADVADVADMDAAMLEAKAAAQRSLPLFRRRLEAERSFESVSGVRVVDDGSNFWLESVQFRGDTVSGLVDGPVDAVRVRTVPTAAIVDWVIVDRDGVHGGYTLRLERMRLTPEAQRIFDQELGAVFLPLP